MELKTVEEDGRRVVEGVPGARFLSRAEDAGLVIEACLSNRALAALLYAENLPEEFFDLSSGQAGAILQKLQNYRIRLAIVCPAGSIELSSRFGDMVAEERRGRSFGMFETRCVAWEWLCRS